MFASIKDAMDSLSTSSIAGVVAKDLSILIDTWTKNLDDMNKAVFQDMDLLHSITAGAQFVVPEGVDDTVTEDTAPVKKVSSIVTFYCTGPDRRLCPRPFTRLSYDRCG